MCERGGSLGDDRARLRGGQSLLGGQAAAGAHHGAMGLGVLQRLGLGVVQRELRVLQLKLGLELVHAGRPIVRKRLREERRSRQSALEYQGGFCFQPGDLR